MQGAARSINLLRLECEPPLPSGLSDPDGLAFDSAGNLFVAEFGEINGGPGTGRIYKFTPDGVRTTFASGLFEPQGLAFDRAGNLFVAAGGTVSKFTPTGVRHHLCFRINEPICSGL